MLLYDWLASMQTKEDEIRIAASGGENSFYLPSFNIMTFATTGLNPEEDGIFAYNKTVVVKDNDETPKDGPVVFNWVTTQHFISNNGVPFSEEEIEKSKSFHGVPYTTYVNNICGGDITRMLRGTLSGLLVDAYSSKSIMVGYNIKFFWPFIAKLLGAEISSLDISKYIDITAMHRLIKSGQALRDKSSLSDIFCVSKAVEELNAAGSYSFKAYAKEVAADPANDIVADSPGVAPFTQYAELIRKMLIKYLNQDVKVVRQPY